MDNSTLAEGLMMNFNLDIEPIALTYVDSKPNNIENFDHEVPSACSFWRLAEQKVFYASAEKHYNCPIGAMVMGFEIPKDVHSNLMEIVKKMCECNYLSANEPEKIPSIKNSSKGVVYGPLKIFPLDPDLIIMWLTPYQTMIYMEALGAAKWTRDVPNQIYGRPACAALPLAFENSSTATSVGCMGMRTFTEIDSDKILTVLSGKTINEFLERLDLNLQANEEMKSFYKSHKEKFLVK